MKKKAVSKIAKGKLAKLVVFNGTKEKTYTGLKKSDEEEGREQDCQGQARKVGGFQWHQGEDLHWLEEERFDQEQEGQDREQEAISKRQEELRQHQGLECRCPEGQESAWCEGLRRSQEGHSSVQEG